jgi:hypothetical protein
MPMALPRYSQMTSMNMELSLLQFHWPVGAALCKRYCPAANLRHFRADVTTGNVPGTDDAVHESHDG